MRLDNPLDKGRTADVYAWDDGLVLKLFHGWMPRSAAQHEARVARAVYEAGLPVPAVGDLLEVDGRRGLLYEHVRGPGMSQVLRSRPWTFVRAARQLAALQARVHDHRPQAGLPAQRERLAQKIDEAPALRPQQRATLLAALADMPAGHRLCHGDFHPANVILAQGGAVIIDWIDATVGHPLADVARTSIILQGEAQRPSAAWYEKLLLKQFHRLYRRAYFRQRPGGETQYRAWRPLVAAARLSEGIMELEDWLLEQADR